MPKISLKMSQEIAVMADGGKKLAEILEEVLEKVEPGLSTLEINSWIEEEILNFGGEPSFKSVPHYHWASCVGLNNEVVHSIPVKDKILKEGDLLKIDLGMLWQEFHTDLSWTTIVQSFDGVYLEPIRQAQGKLRREAQDKSSKACPELAEGFKSLPRACRGVQSCQREFLDTGKRALEEAIKVAIAGNRVGHISQKIQEIVEDGGYSPVEVLSGHGIGKKLHEEPLIPEFLLRRIEDTPELVPGMTLAIEVIYNFGSPEVVLGTDGWTVLTKDGKMAGLFEETIAITCNGPLILTPLSGIKESKSRGCLVC